MTNCLLVQEAGAGSSNEKVPSKPSSKVVQGVTIEDLKVGHGPEAKNGSTVSSLCWTVFTLRLY